MVTYSPKTIFQLPVDHVQQSDEMLCWAACNESLSCYYKKCVPQLTAFEAKYGLPEGSCKLQRCNLPSDPVTAARTLTQTTGYSFIPYQINENDRPTLLKLFFSLIYNRVPFIVNIHQHEGRVGHAVVCKGVIHNKPDQFGQIVVTEFIVMNPAKGKSVFLEEQLLVQKSTSIIVLEDGMNSLYSTTNYSNSF